MNQKKEVKRYRQVKTHNRVIKATEKKTSRNLKRDEKLCGEDQRISEKARVKATQKRGTTHQ